MRQVIALVAGVGIAAALVGCGERPQVVNYKQGTYQGKPDQKAYDTAPWNGNKRDWELALANRNQSQNEYKRIR
jgi:hypothetical protein